MRRLVVSTNTHQLCPLCWLQAAPQRLPPLISCILFIGRRRDLGGLSPSLLSSLSLSSSSSLSLLSSSLVLPHCCYLVWGGHRLSNCVWEGTGPRSAAPGVHKLDQTPQCLPEPPSSEQKTATWQVHIGTFLPPLAFGQFWSEGGRCGWVRDLL